MLRTQKSNLSNNRQLGKTVRQIGNRQIDQYKNRERKGK